jgi:hypothetical protein
MKSSSHRKWNPYSILSLALAILFLASCADEISMDIPEEQNEFPLAEKKLERFVAEDLLLTPAGIMSEEEQEALLEGLSEDDIRQLEQLQENAQFERRPAVGSASVLFREAEILSAKNQGDGFGSSLAGGGPLLYIGAPNSGQVHVYGKSLGGIAELAVITPSNGAKSFGTSIVATDNFLAVGAPLANENKGQVFIYKRDGLVWKEVAMLEKVGSQLFGQDLALGKESLAVLARKRARGVPSEIVVYDVARDGVSLGQVISGGDRIFTDIDMEGGRLVANGAATVTNLMNIFHPSIYVFEQEGVFWIEKPKIGFPRGEIIPRSVALSGGRLVANCGSPGDKTFVFNYKAGTWFLNATLTHDARLTYEAQPITSKENIIMVGHPYQALTADYVSVYVQGSSGLWGLYRTFKPDAQMPARYVFGKAVLLHNRKAVVGIPDGDMSSQLPLPGLVYRY